MLDQSLLQSHFIGRDGFRWWMGQVPPVETWEEQANKQGWGNRVKVRILGYHPLDPSELSDDELPWAQVMLPTTAGSGGANFAVNPKITQGDMVIGFFLDGDNAQIPVIMGLLGRTEKWSTLGYTNPFVPFTGYTEDIPKPSDNLRKADQTNQQTAVSQESPRAIPPEVAKRNREATASSAIGDTTVFADSCEDTTFKTIKSEINNFLKDLQEFQGKIDEYKGKIRKVAEVIKGALNWLVGEMMRAIECFLVGTEEKPGIIPRALQALYINVYGSTFAATGNPAAAHTAAYKATEFFVIPIKLLEKALSCVGNAVIEGLKDLIIQILESLLQNIKSFVTCAAEQFIGVILNTVVDKIADGLSSALDGISFLISGVFSVSEFLRSNSNLLSGLNNELLDCNQSNSKCDGTKEWIVGVGPKKSSNTNFNSILNAMNTAGTLVNNVIQDVSGGIQSFENAASAITSTIDIFNGNSSLPSGSLDQCYTGTPVSCGPPTLNIFGGGGINGAAAPIFGSVIQSTTLYQNVERTSSIIGAVITNVGSGYRFPPFVEIVDNCGLGYGAKARATINDKGELESIYITSSGTGYPVGDQEPSGVVDTVVQSSGFDYSPNDTAVDNFGNQYNLTVEDGRIISAKPINTLEVSDLPKIRVNSETGYGAILKPVFGSISYPSEIKTSIDCPI